MKRVRLAPVLALLCLTLSAGADEAARQSALAKMPVKEITVFKDGHPFVLHQGKMPVDADGNVQMDYLPTPVLGTFWPYSADKNVKLVSVTASPRRVLVERTTLTVPELLEANPGAAVQVTQNDGKSYSAEILRVPTRSATELEATAPPNSGDKLPEKSHLVLLKTTEGAAVVNMDGIRDLLFKGPFKDKLADEEFRNLLTLKLDWPGGKAEKTAEVGMVYLQKGIRWIPNYRVKIDGKGNATVTLQAILLNEMTDLEDVTANLVIGVPSFAFQETPDPISLQQSFAQLSPFFQTGSPTGFAFSNAIASQAAYAGASARSGAERFGGGAAGPDVVNSGKTEDMYVFTVKKSDKETTRTPNAVKWQGEDYGRVDLAGVITLTNFLSEPIEVEVTRNVLGNVDRADHDGVATMVNQVEDDDDAARTPYPSWWGSYSWPNWWSHFNGVGRLAWTIKIPAGKSVDMGYTWHYFWR